jgi:hypothetical protein
VPRATDEPSAGQVCEVLAWVARAPEDSGVAVPGLLVIQFLFALTGYALAAKWFVAPALTGRPLRSALPPLLLPHLARPISLWLLAPGVLVQPSLPIAFAQGTAYGDLVVATLAVIVTLLVRREHRFAVPAVWIFNVLGLLDALRNCIVGMRTHAPEHMGAMVFVPAYGVPLLLVSHALIFKVLLEHRARARHA